jgi:hypothetical protein
MASKMPAARDAGNVLIGILAAQGSVAQTLPPELLASGHE